MDNQSKEIELYQRVVITLSDGRYGTFVGIALVGKQDENLKIIDIKFTEPHALPSGCYFEAIDTKDC